MIDRMIVLAIILNILSVFTLSAQTGAGSVTHREDFSWVLYLLFALVFITLLGALYLHEQAKKIRGIIKKRSMDEENARLKEYVNTLTSKQIGSYIKFIKVKSLRIKTGSFGLLVFVFSLLTSPPSFGQPASLPASVLGEEGIIITLVLILIPVLAGIILMIVKIRNVLKRFRKSGILKKRKGWPIC